MRSSGFAVVLAVTLVAGGCSALPPLPMPVPSPDVMPEPLPALAAETELPDGRMAVEDGGTRLSLYLADPGGPFEEVGTVDDGAGHLTVHLYTMGGETGRITNSFLFGRAPKGATSVEGGPNAVAGRVDAGLFVVALAAKDMPPDAIFWTFRNADGTILDQGSGGRS